MKTINQLKLVLRMCINGYKERRKQKRIIFEKKIEHMKIKILILAVVLGATAFTIDTNKNSATVESQNGISIFCYSKPTEKYDILGMAKVSGIVTNEKGQHMIELLIEKAKKNYPSGEAIIVNSDFQKAEVIKFKD